MESPVKKSPVVHTVAATPVKHVVQTVATPQKAAPSPMPPSHEPVHTPGQTPIKSPALKKTCMAPGPEALTEVIEVPDTSERSGSVADTKLTMSQEDDWPHDRQPDFTPTKTVSPPGSPKAPIHPGLKRELDILDQQYQKRIAAILEIKNKKREHMSDANMIKALDAWGDKEAKEAERRLNQASEAAFLRYEQDSEAMQIEKMMEELTGELSSLKIDGSPPATLKTSQARLYHLL